MTTPPGSLEVLLAKIVPTFLLTMCAFYLATLVGRLAFALPLRGSLFALTLGTALFIVVGMSIGLLFATFAQTTLQAILSSFFVTLPMVQLSGTVAPLDKTPPFV